MVHCLAASIRAGYLKMRIILPLTQLTKNVHDFVSLGSPSHRLLTVHVLDLKTDPVAVDVKVNVQNLIITPIEPQVAEQADHSVHGPHSPLRSLLNGGLVSLNAH